jgi:hypothetical protein
MKTSQIIEEILREARIKIAFKVDEKILKDINELENIRKEYLKKLLEIQKENEETLSQMKELFNKYKLLENDKVFRSTDFKNFETTLSVKHGIENVVVKQLSRIVHANEHELEKLGIDNEYDLLDIKTKKQTKNFTDLTKKYSDIIFEKIKPILAKFFPEISFYKGQATWYLIQTSQVYNIEIYINVNIKNQLLKILEINEIKNRLTARTKIALKINEHVLKDIDNIENIRKQTLKKFLQIQKENEETVEQMKDLFNKYKLLEKTNAQSFEKILHTGFGIEGTSIDYFSLFQIDESKLQKLGIDDEYDFLYLKFKKQKKDFLDLRKKYSDTMFKKIKPIILNFLPGITFDTNQSWFSISGYGYGYSIDINIARDIKDQFLKILENWESK